MKAIAIDRLELRNFTVFDRATFDFVRGINVLMGENGTGKSQILRVLSACPVPRNDFVARLLTSFSADADGDDLARNGQPANVACTGTVNFRKSIPLDATGRHVESPNGVVLLTASERFTDESNEVSIQRTNLYASPFSFTSSSKVKTGMEDIAIRLVAKIGGAFTIVDERYQFMGGGVLRDASLVAEGHRKLGMLANAVVAGAAARGTLLLWDEPEAHLHPALTEFVVDTLVDLAKAGVQVVVSTHSYLVARLLSRRAEDYPNDPCVRFFSLYRSSEHSSVAVETGDMLADINHDAILDAFSRYDVQELERDARAATVEAKRRRRIRRVRKGAPKRE